MKATLLLLALAALLSSSNAAPLCLGYKEFPELNADCRARANETSCMQGYAFRSANLTVTCVWHHLTDTKVIDRQIVHNRRGILSLSGVNYEGTVCSNSVSVMLPKSANGVWGTYMRMISGPQNTSRWTNSEFPKESFVTSSCTAGQGATDTCRMKNTAPKGLALNPAFKSNSIVMDFSTTDKTLIEQFNTSQRLNYPLTLKFKLEIEGTRCINPDKYPAEGPAILDKVAFGPSAFMLNENRNHYFLRTYKAYRVANVTGIDWSVNVTKSMVKSGKKTKMTVMLMRESDYFNWTDNQCTTNCTPPVAYALPNSVCKGISCSGRIRGLGAKTGAYRLLVSYPEIASVDWNSTFSNTAPIQIWPKYKKQMVKVEIWPKSWSLQDPVVRQEEIALSAGKEGEAVDAEEEALVEEEAAFDDEARAVVEGEEVIDQEPILPQLGTTTTPIPLPAPVVAAVTVPAPASVVGPAPVVEFVAAEAFAEQAGGVLEEENAGEARSFMLEFDTPMFKPTFGL